MVFVMFGVDLEEWLYNIFVFVLKGDSFGFPERWEYERFGHQSRC